MKKLRADGCQGMLAIISAKSLLFHFAIQKYRDLIIQNYNFVRYFLWV
jgi:hypothetical protein